jgi:release factor glutamine methyltransferase
VFCFGETVESEVIYRVCPVEPIKALERLGILQWSDSNLGAGDFRLVYHLGLYLFCHRTSADAVFYYGTDSIALSRILTPVSGSVLDLCAGVGAQALFCARSASSVTAVEIEPSAEPVFWINCTMNGLEAKNVEFLCGDLFSAVPGRKFDRICANPPFLPVPTSIRFPRYAGGGSEGLDIVRRVLEGLPSYLSSSGECHIIASALGNSGGPNLSSLRDLPVSANLEINVSCYSYEELNEDTVSLFAASALDCMDGGGAREAYRRHFRQLNATNLYYFVLRARPA